MKIAGIAQRDRLHDVLRQAVVHPRRAPQKPSFISALLPSRFLALQKLEPAELAAA
jgi:hypothetical protein